MTSKNLVKSASWLREAYAERRRKNSNFSLRAFAKQLGIAAPRLCDVLNEKRIMTASMGKRIADRLELSPKQEESLIKLIHEDRDKSNGIFKQKKIDSSYTPLQEDIFRAIADWYHFAILELTRLNDFTWNYEWMGKRLNITNVEARQATERLLRLGLLVTSGKELKLNQKSFTTTHDIPSSALRASHRQSLEMAIKNLDETPVDLRDITSITIATNLSKLPEAKRLIKNFRRRLSKHLETGRKTEIYNINIQLVPVTREVNNGRS